MKGLIEKGDTFYATVKLGPHSKDLLGNECAGKKIGPFVATRVLGAKVEAGGRQFVYQDFMIIKQ